MQQLTFKKNLKQSKIDTLLNYLSSWNIEAELKPSSNINKKKTNLSLAAGIWKDYNITANELRKQAWSRSK